MLADGVINLVVAPEVSSIDPTASIVINNLRIPGLQTRRAKTTVELRDGESFALAGLLRRDFQDTVRQFPILGSIPIIGTLFRSTSFQKEETELVIIVTPRLVRPVRAGGDEGADRSRAAAGRGRPVPARPHRQRGRLDPVTPEPSQTTRPVTRPWPPPRAGTAPTGVEGDYGHILE